MTTPRIALLVVLLVALSGCAAKSYRDRAQVAALSVADTIVALDQAERDLYVSGAYGQTEHEKVSLAIWRVARAGQAYTAAVGAWPDAGRPNVPTSVLAATAGLNIALDSLLQSLPASDRVRAVLGGAVLAIQQAIALSQARHEPSGLPPVQQAIALAGILSMITLANKLVTELQARAKQEGATPEQLAEAMGRLDAVADRREDELRKAGLIP